MSARDMIPTPFNFEGRDVRVALSADGEPLFHAGDVCAALVFANPRQALDSHVDAEDVQKLDTLTSGGVQQMNHINESGLYALILGATKAEAKRFKKWVTSEVLPSIRKTGTYSAPAAPAKPPGRAAQSLLSDAKAIDFIGNMVAKVPGARADVVAAIKLRMIEERTGLPATLFGGALPAESLAIAVKLNPTQIGRRLSPKLSPIRVNALLIGLGMQRKSESGYVLTEVGAAHGESRPYQAENHHVGDQINWHESVIDVISASLVRPPGGQQPLL